MSHPAVLVGGTEVQCGKEEEWTSVSTISPAVAFMVLLPGCCLTLGTAVGDCASLALRAVTFLFLTLQPGGGGGGGRVLL